LHTSVQLYIQPSDKKKKKRGEGEVGKNERKKKKKTLIIKLSTAVFTCNFSTQESEAEGMNSRLGLHSKTCLKF
jgi:hypothetical protein